MQPISERRVYLCTFSPEIRSENLIRNNLMSERRLNVSSCSRQNSSQDSKAKFPLALFVTQLIDRTRILSLDLLVHPATGSLYASVNRFLLIQIGKAFSESFFNLMKKTATSCYFRHTVLQ